MKSILGVVFLFVSFISGDSTSPTIISAFWPSISDKIKDSSTDELTQVEHSTFPKIDPNIAEDTILSTPQLVTKYGYVSEIHHVTTEDGYILEMHRISGGPNSPPKEGKPICFLQHGLLDSSATWVLTGTKHGLGYKLSDEGYDVWMGNARGNHYSRNHTKYNPYGSWLDRRHYWKFSWHQIGFYDLPAMVDYVLLETGEKKMHFIGHSQGTTAFFVMCAERPDYNNKIWLMQALAPVAFMSHVTSPPIRAIAPFVFVIEKITSLIGVYEIAPSNKFLTLAGKELCQDKAITQVVCENILFLIMGYTSDQLNTTLLPVILGHTPAGSATDQLIHYGQEVQSGHFRQFDWGRVENLIYYKRMSPPDYNLRNVRASVALYYAQDDWLAGAKDIKRLSASLPNVVKDYLIPHKSFNHVDFVWGIDAPYLVYEAVINLMKEIDQGDINHNLI